MWICQTQQIVQLIDKITFRHKENHIIVDKKHKTDITESYLVCKCKETYDLVAGNTPT